jgi:hypothetical protein
VGGICGNELRMLWQIDPEPVDRLWEPYLACGTLALLSGEAGSGTTFMALALAAAITRRREETEKGRSPSAGSAGPGGAPDPHCGIGCRGNLHLRAQDSSEPAAPAVPACRDASPVFTNLPARGIGFGRWRNPMSRQLTRKRLRRSVPRRRRLSRMIWSFAALGGPGTGNSDAACKGCNGCEG